MRQAANWIRPTRLKGVVIFGTTAVLLLSLAVTGIALLVIRVAAPARLAVRRYSRHRPPGLAIEGDARRCGGYPGGLPSAAASARWRRQSFGLVSSSSWSVYWSCSLRRHLTPEIAAGVHALTYLGALLAVVGYLLPRIRRDVWAASATITARAWFGAAAGFALTNAAYVVTENTGVIMLAALADPEAVGIYRAAARYAQLVPFALLAAMLPLRPAISAAFAREDRTAQREAARTAAALAMAIGLPVSNRADRVRRRPAGSLR